jgi:hypothetical protein
VPALNIVFVLPAILLLSGASAAAQSPFVQAARGTIHFPGQGEPIPGLRGFSISLVQGSLTTGTASDVPPAAAKALADLRDFLPYKSYKLLDTQWSAGSGRVTGRLRGVNGKEYELELSTRREPGRDGSLSVSRFVLREPGSDATAGGSAFLYGGGGTSGTQGRPAPADEVAVAELRRELERTQAAQVRAAQAQGQAFTRFLTSVRPVIDTSFSMDIGETIVVGTSRLQGDTALIVLLTAVPRAATAQGR